MSATAERAKAAAPAETDPAHLRDWQWVFEQRQLDPSPFHCFQGLFVAVYERQVVGAAAPGALAGDLAERVAERLNVPAVRPVVTYIEDGE